MRARAMAGYVLTRQGLNISNELGTLETRFGLMDAAQRENDVSAMLVGSSFQLRQQNTLANKRIENIKVSASGDWSFIKDITAVSK